MGPALALPLPHPPPGIGGSAESRGQRSAPPDHPRRLPGHPHRSLRRSGPGPSHPAGGQGIAAGGDRGTPQTDPPAGSPAPFPGSGGRGGIGGPMAGRGWGRAPHAAGPPGTGAGRDAMAALPAGAGLGPLDGTNAAGSRGCRSRGPLARHRTPAGPPARDPPALPPGLVRRAARSIRRGRCFREDGPRFLPGENRSDRHLPGGFGGLATHSVGPGPRTARRGIVGP